MRCFVLSDDGSWESLFNNAPGLTLIHTSSEEIEALEEDVLFDLRNEAWDLPLYNKFRAPVFISAVIGTLAEHNTPGHVVRINGWAGMLAKPILEACASEEIKTKAADLLSIIGKQVEWVDDVPGMVSARVIAMIINEAAMAEAEGVSDASSINTAMRLGTNYPYGPFEWGAMIGMEKISALLTKLSLTNARYISNIKNAESA